MMSTKSTVTPQVTREGRSGAFGLAPRLRARFGLALGMLLCASLTSCNFLLNEAFIWDVPAPPVEVPTGVTAGS